MPSHLPLLLNPLFNAIFNNPQPEKSPLKDVYARLANGWEDGTVLVVPPLKVLLSCVEGETGVEYADLCYTEDFLKDHIMVTDEGRNARLFKTLSGKEVLVKKETLFLGKGFKRSHRLKVLECGYFQSFNDYFAKGKRFMVMYVDGPLIGTPEDSRVIDIVTPSNNASERIVLQDFHNGSNQSGLPISTQSLPQQSSSIQNASPSNGYDDQNNGLDSDNSSAADNGESSLKFEQIIRTYPLVAKSVGEKYATLFRAFSVKEISDRDSLIQMFIQASNASSHIFQTLSDDLVNGILRDTPELDLNECVYNYVELNLYDKVWSKLCDLNPDFLAVHYEELDHLSLNQVSLPGSYKDDIHTQSILEKRISKAIVEFRQLELTSNAQSKTKTFVKTISILSNIEGLTIDADTLVGLLLLVIVHAGVPKLENHLFYVQNFSFHNVDLGMKGYALSTIEGVLYYLRDEENIGSLKKYSNSNKKVFSYIDSKELMKLKMIADDFHNETDSSLKSRTVNGDSLLMLAIQSNDYDTWKLLIDYEEVFPLEDIITDTNINDASLLNTALNSENFDIIDEITDILFSSCTANELKTYLNLKDVHNRTIGHYLFHYPKSIAKLGPFIDWTSKDMNGQTPLFAICRSYDCANYDHLIDIVFETVEKWYKTNGSEFDYADHIDNRGNTLLHILNSKIDVLLKYNRLNVNEVNLKTFTPLMIYAKYNRLENIGKIINDEHLNICKNDKNHFTCLDQSKNPMVSNLIEIHFLNEKIDSVQGKQIGIIRVKLENNNWKLVLRGRIHDVKYETSHSFGEFKHLIELIKIEFPNSFIPIDHTLTNFEMILNFGSFNKLKLNKIIDHLNIFLQACLFNKPLLNYELLWEFLIEQEFNNIDLTQRSKLKMLNYKQDLASDHRNKGPVQNHNNDIWLQPEEISEINAFLKFSLKEITKTGLVYDKLFKVVNFQARKESELKDSVLLLADTEAELSKEFQFLNKLLGSQYKEFVFDDDFCDMSLYLTLSCDEIIYKINDIINNKIFRWWKLYGEMIELNNTYKRFKMVELKKVKNNSSGGNGTNTIQTNGNHEVQGLYHLNEESFNDLTTDTSFSTNPDRKSSKKQSTPSFLVNFIESKRQKYETKLLDALKDVKQRLVQLNTDIKFNHETIAEEMNNFVSYKTDLLNAILKKYIKRQVKNLKFQNKMLQRGLDDLRYLNNFGKAGV